MCQARLEDWQDRAVAETLYLWISFYSVFVHRWNPRATAGYIHVLRGILVSWRRRKMGDTCGMSQPEWRVILYVKRLIEALRKLMKSTLVDDDQAVDNALEIFKQACAEAIAQVTDYYMIHKARLYAALIVDPTLSSASCYQCAEAHRCNSCPKCRLIKQSHHKLVQRRLPMAKWNRTHAENSSPICRLEKLSKLSQHLNFTRTKPKKGQ